MAPAKNTEKWIFIYRGESKISGKGVRMHKGVGVRFASFYLIFLKYPLKMNSFGLTETKVFHSHRLFQNGWVGVSSEPLNRSGLATVI